MSNSPPTEKDVEHSAQSGEEQEHMDREQEGAQGAGLGDFEVKEQDRWLPIANGWCCLILPSALQVPPFRSSTFDLPVPCVTVLPTEPDKDLRLSDCVSRMHPAF
jgi:hypothetical protein